MRLFSLLRAEIALRARGCEESAETLGELRRLLSRFSRAERLIRREQRRRRALPPAALPAVEIGGAR